MTHPKRVNSNHFSTEKFPEVLAFCDREESSHILNSSVESYTYTLNGKTIYTVKKSGAQWELEESHNNNIVRVSIGRSLGQVLMQGLRFSDSDKGKQEERVNILFPVQRANVEKALALMYYYGGYPANFLQMTPELALIVERFVGAQLTFLSYSYVPIGYLEWLNEQLKNAGVLELGAKSTLWVYKK